MVNIQMKRIYEPYAPEDGFRVLADRLWPRGVSKERARLDLWADAIAPSNELRKEYHGGTIGWQEFEGKFRRELAENPFVDEFVEIIRGMDNTVTLLFAGKDTENTHVKVLIEVIREKNRPVIQKRA
ncbi:MAG: DUF488 family protein [Defluviitaleaceae bacterium]|nr:DUF488 family protein [Defluviitaleaceae bacterium]